MLLNAIKHQNYRNSNVRSGINAVLSECPQEILNIIKYPSDFGKPFERKTDKQTQLIDDRTMTVKDPTMSLEDRLHTNTDTNTDLILTKPNAKPRQGFDKSKTLNPKVYAKAVKADAALKVKETEARDRSGGSGKEFARLAAEKLKRKGK